MYIIYMQEHTCREMEREAEAQKRETVGEMPFFEIFSFGRFLIEHIFFCPEQLKRKSLHSFVHPQTSSSTF